MKQPCASWIRIVAVLLATGVQAQERGPRLYREVPDDPPAARAARSVLEARSPGRKAQVGGYVSVQVNVDPAGSNVPDDAANEPSIAVDPTDPNRIVIGWRQFDHVSSNFRQAGWAYSDDGGETWTFPGVLEADVFRTDPVLDVDSSGRFFFQSLEVLDPFGTPENTNDVWRSTDGGLTWQPPVEAFGGEKSWMCVDRTGGTGDGHVYGTWSESDFLPCQPCGTACCTDENPCCTGSVCCGASSCCDFGNLTRSIDGGDSYQQPVSFNHPAEEILDSFFTAQTMAVGPDGELYAGGVGFVGLAQRFEVYRSDDARDPASSPTFSLNVVELGGTIGFPGDADPNPEGFLGQVEIAVDRSDGPTRGHVYLLASVIPEVGADPADVHFARSTDGGATWSAPVRVNNDEAGNWQWFGTLSVAPDGRIDAIWNDTRAASGQHALSELYYAFSFDGGATWLGNVPVSPQWDSTKGWPNQNKIGDYYDMVSDASGVSVAYAATFNGEQDVYFLRIPAPILLFADGFESGDVSAWTAARP